MKEVPENFTFDISFTVENGNLDKFTPPNFNGFDVYGPSQSQNISIINGNVSKSFSYTYTLQPKKQGSFTINPANAVINGKTFSTQPIAIKVIAPQQKQTQNRRRQQNYDPFEDFFGSGESQRPSEAEIKKELNEGIFVKVTPNKTTLYEGDQVTLSYKLYFRLRYDGLNATKMPTYNGFLSEDFDIPIDQQKEPEIEVYNGKKYYVQEFKRVALFPQKSGKTTIDPMSFSCVVGVEIPNNFNPFFSDIEPYEYNFNSNAVNLEVLPLPSPQPKNFSGAVGKFNFQASYDKTQVKVGEPIKLKITYNGTGNLRLISAPKLTFPEEFEAYEPKLNENYASKGNIISGTKSYEYTLIPQDGGTFKLPEYEFGYFDLDKRLIQPLNFLKLKLQYLEKPNYQKI
ncbi:MAG: BatD family protein [Chitinophagales bacterium]